MKRPVALALAATLAAAVPASAQSIPIQSVLLRNSFNPFGAGARGLGMGGAFIAVADDGTASTFNPAGLAQLRRAEFALVGFGGELRSTVANPVGPGGGPGETRTDRSRHGAPDFVGLAVPFEVAGRNLTVQLSYQRAVDLFGQGRTDTAGGTSPAELNLTPADLARLGITPTTTIVLSSAIEPRQRGAFHTASLAGAYQFSSRLSLGVALNYWIGEWHASGRSTSSLAVPVRLGSPPTTIAGFEQEFTQVQSLRGFNVNAGLMLKYSRLSVGGVVRMPFGSDYRLDETGVRRDFVRQQPAGPDQTIAARMTSRMHWPFSAGLGVALRPFRGLTLAGDVSVFQWSRTYIEDVPSGALLTAAEPDGATTFTDRSFFDLFPAVQTDTDDTRQWRAGLEYLVSLPRIVVPLRGGVFRDRSPVLDTGTNRGREIKGWTAGTGLNFSRLVIDVAFERRESEGFVGVRLRPSTTGAVIDTSRSPFETVTEDRVVASIIYRAGGDDDPLKKAFRFLFLGGREKGDE